jgi:dCMP deaminase
MHHHDGRRSLKASILQAHLDVAARYAELSSARRLKVGAIIVKDNRIISIGYNGTPPGWDNNCEELVHRIAEEPVLKTLPEVIHAEENAIAKLARSHESGEGATMFITHAPCAQCAKMILVSGIGSVYYRQQYRDDAGIKFLQRGGVAVQQLESKDGN